MKRIPGANRDLARLVTSHLFVVCPNNSGSSFLAAALETCRAVWRLPREGHRIRGFAGPVPWRMRRPEDPPPDLLWAARQEWIDRFADPRRHDWPLTRKAWYFHSLARDPDACVFVVKSPPHLLHVAQLQRHFPNARFVFMVRNPYAVCEGICRRYRTRLVHLHRSGFGRPARDLETAAARHVAACLAWQRHNVGRYRDSGVFFTYEAMCAAPSDVAHRIRRLVPELADLDLRQRLVAKDYHEMLTDMNDRQIANLGNGQIAAFNRVFRERRELLRHFGYAVIDET